MLTQHELAQMSKPELERLVKILYGLLETKATFQAAPACSCYDFKITRERKPPLTQPITRK